MDLLLFLLTICGVGCLSFEAGRLSTQPPSEEEMFRRIVEARAQRKNLQMANDELERELNRKV